MSDLDVDLHTWTEERLEAEIQELLPVGQMLSCQLSVENRCWEVAFRDPEGLVVWSATNIDRRLALFDAYGVLWASKREHTAGVWSVHARPTKASVQQHVAQRYRDPEDLDPEEIASVYGVKQ